MLDAGRLDADLGARDGGEPDERSDFDVVRADAVRTATDWLTAMNGDRVGADALDLRAERVQEMREVLDVRLGGGITQDRRAARCRRGNERVLRRGDTRLVEEHVGADERF